MGIGEVMTVTGGSFVCKKDSTLKNDVVNFVFKDTVLDSTGLDDLILFYDVYHHCVESRTTSTFVSVSLGNEVQVLSSTTYLFKPEESKSSIPTV